MDPMKKLTFTTFIVFSGAFLFFPLLGQAAEIGQSVSFFVDSSYDVSQRSTLTATLQEKSDHAYFYTEDDWMNKLDSSSAQNVKTAIRQLAVEFDQKIYPKLTTVYGKPWEPGIDNDPKITILISKMQTGTGGYFNSADEYPHALSLYSNEREMLYLNANYLNSSQAKVFLAHEFQHLITFYQKEKLRGVVEDVWLNEARSEFTSTLLGYDTDLIGSNLEKRIFDFFKNPSDSLTEWTNNMIDYGSVNLFMQYLVAHFGEQILTKMVQSQKVGTASIDEALAVLGFPDTFESVFENWVIANYLKDCKISGQKYCYLNVSLDNKIKIPPTLEKSFSLTAPSYSIELNDSIKDWSGHWYKYSGGVGNFLKIDFKAGQNANFKVAYIIEKADGSVTVKFLPVNSSGQGTDAVASFGLAVKSVVLIPISETKKSNFGATEPFFSFSFLLSLVGEYAPPPQPTSVSPSAIVTNPPVSSSFPDGSLLRAKGDSKVYVISGIYKRWIQSPEIFNAYQHLKWENIIEVSADQLAFYKDAWLVRSLDDTKVYEIDASGTKHWLNMTAEQFSSSGRSWEAVFIINNFEKDWYKSGKSILK